MLDIARSDEPVLIVGEFGSGRKALALHIHHSGPRAGKPFFRALYNPRHWDNYRGVFSPPPPKPWFTNPQLASGGALLVEMVHQLEADGRSIIEAVIERAEIRTGPTPHEICSSNSRVISTVRDDFFVDGRVKGLDSILSSRLSANTIRIPPLRERMADFQAFVSIFVNNWNRAYGKSVQLDSAVVDVLRGYSWPGNLHQLNGVIADFMWRAKSDEITVRDLTWGVARWKGRRSSRASDEMRYGRPSLAFGTYLRDRL